jgi:hypothetical protein
MCVRQNIAHVQLFDCPYYCLMQHINDWLISSPDGLYKLFLIFIDKRKRTRSDHLEMNMLHKFQRPNELSHSSDPLGNMSTPTEDFESHLPNTP